MFMRFFNRAKSPDYRIYYLNILGCFLLSVLSACLVFAADSKTQAILSETYDVGVAWEGESCMQERVLSGIQKALAEQAPKIKLDIRRNLKDIAALEKTVESFEHSKNAMVILRSSGAKLLGKRGAKIPAFIGGCNDPVALGAAESLEKPAHLVTGVTYSVPALVQLRTFHDIYPAMQKILLLVEAGHPGSKIDVTQTLSAAEILGLKARIVYCHSLAEACREVQKAHEDEVIIIGIQAMLMDNIHQILNAAGTRLVFAYSESAVEHGAIGGVVANDEKLGEMLGTMLVRHLVQHVPIGSMPIQTDPEPTLRLNYSVLERYHAKIPFTIRSLAKSQQMLERITISAPSGIGIIRNQRLVMANKYICQLTGYSKAELDGQSLKILFQDQAAYEQVLKTIKNFTPEHSALETLIQTKAGSHKDVILSFTLLDPSSSETGIVFTLQDITELRQAEASLHTRTITVAAALGFIVILFGLLIALIRMWNTSTQAAEALGKSEENLSITLNSIGDAVLATDNNGSVIRMNPVAEKLTGWTMSEARNLPIDQVLLMKDPNTKESTGLLQSKESNKRNEMLLTAKNGKEYRVTCTGSPLCAKDSSIIGGVWVLRDVTAEHTMQEQLRQGQKLDAIGRLAGGVAHDFNNMLGGILGSAELLRIKTDENSSASEYIDIIHDSAKRASELASGLLAFSRKQPLRIIPVDIHQIIRNALSILGSTIDRRIQIKLDLTNEYSVIMGDKSQLQSIFLNLGINASHAMPSGGELRVGSSEVTLSPAYCEQSPFDIMPGDYLEIEVTDTGHGIRQEHLSRIFEPFFTTKEPGNGTGLGLAAVYGGIQQHKGAITVYSQQDKGTSFHLFFPLCKEGIAEKEKAEPSLSGEGLILLIDDEEVMRVTGKALLEECGYHVMLAKNGKEGVDLFSCHASEINVVILDMIMPVMNGRDCFFSLKEICPDVKIILSSGFVQPKELAELQENGLTGFIRKPYQITELSRAVACAME
jgi:PAS domain S-box-containing protein